MSILIAQFFAIDIAYYFDGLVNTAKVYFSDDTSLEINNVTITITHDNEQKKYFVNFQFSINTEETKTLTKIEYYYKHNEYYDLILVRDELSININSGTTQITHEVSISYQV
jgi:hypothetical protein